MNQKVYMWIGTFAVVMMIYLFVAPKLVKKSAGEPPRSGSNAEQLAIAQTIGTGRASGAGFPYSLPGGSGTGLRVFPEGGRGPRQSGASFGGSNPAAFKIGQAYRGRRAFRGFKSRNPKMNLFPFANVSLA
jgi:hypothetical protein